MKASRPRILYLAPCRPDAPSSGTQLRVLNVARALREVGDLSIVVTAFAEEDCVCNSGRGGEFAVERFFPVQPVPPRGLRDRLRCAADPRFVNPHGHEIVPEGRDWLAKHLDDFDLVWLHHLKTANRSGRWAWQRSVMDIDDVPSTYLRTVCCKGDSVPRRMRYGMKRWVALRRERLLAERFSVLSVCSEADRKYLDLRIPVHVIPNGFDAPPGEVIRKPSAPPRIGFIGVFSYEPNLDGIRWFAEKCWPLIKRECPEAELRLVGRDTDGSLKPEGQDICGLGYVENTSEEIGTWSAMIIPVHLGAGTRVKVADGFSRKVPMIATSLGAYGYAVKDSVEMLIADSSEGFAASCLKVIREPVASAAMAERGWLRFQKEWSWDAIRPRIWATAEDCLARRTTADRH